MSGFVATAPNASVAPVHDRMPLVLGPDEPSIWLGQNFESLAAKERPPLESAEEEV